MSLTDFCQSFWCKILTEEEFPVQAERLERRQDCVVLVLFLLLLLPATLMLVVAVALVRSPLLLLVLMRRARRGGELDVLVLMLAVAGHLGDDERQPGHGDPLQLLEVEEEGVEAILEDRALERLAEEGILLVPVNETGG